MNRTILAAALCASLAGQAQSAEVYVPLGLGSYHANATREFNEFNPSIGIGIQSEGDRVRYGAEVGIAYNSYEHWGSYGAVFANVRLAEFDNVSFWGGAFVGLAEYPNLINYAEKKGIPTVGDHIMVAGLTGIAEFERFSFVVNVIPFGEAMSGVAIFKIQIRIGGN